jgi:hypothetical protein
MKRQSKYQLCVQKELIKISGRPKKIYNMAKMGPLFRVWTWDTGKIACKDRIALLVLADKARDLGLQVFLQCVNKRGSFLEAYKNIDPSGPLEEVNRVIVWCPEA